MKTPYDAGLRLRKQELDTLRRQLGALHARQDALEQSLAEIDGEVAAEAQRTTPEDMASFADFGAYLGRQQLAKQAIFRELDALKQEMEKLQEAVGDAFAEFKTLDIAATRFIEAARQEAARREQAEMDEAALLRHQTS